jgi:SH3-like domain-containing protein
MISPQQLITTSMLSLLIVINEIGLAGQVDRLPPKQQCLAKAYTIDSTKNGVNVRYKPNLSGRILGQLPKNVEVNVLGMQDKWTLISVIDPVAQKVAFRSEGWVYSALLGVSSMGYGEKSVNLYAQPSLRSETEAKIPPNSTTKILGCSGKWLRVETKNQQRGWLEPSKQCAAAYTSCS